jgi:hypothetical protein
MLGLQFLIMGLFFMSFTIYPFIQDIRTIFRIISIKRDAVRKMGIVKELIYNDEESLAPKLEVQYNDENGNTYEIKTSTGFALWRNKKGKEIEVVYKKTKPSLVYVVNDIRLQFIIFFVIHFIFVLVGSIFIVNAFRIWFFQ